MNRALSLAEALERLAQGVDKRLDARWAELLDIAPDTPEFYSTLSVIYGRFVDLRHEIMESHISERAKNLYGSATTQLAAYANPSRVGQHTVQQLASLKDKIDLLHLAADALPDRLIPELQQPVLDELYKELEEIRDAARDLNSDAQTKRLVEDSINTLIMVLRSYKTLGPDGAARIYGSVAAELLRSFRDTPTEKSQTKTVLQRALGTVKKVGAAVIFAGAVVHGADQLLTDGTDVAGFVIGLDEVGQESTPKSEKVVVDEPEAVIPANGKGD